MLRRIFRCRMSCLTALLTINVIVVTILILLQSGFLRSLSDSMDKPRELPNEDKRPEGEPKFKYNEEIVGVPLSYDDIEENRVKQAGGIDTNRYDPAKPIDFIPPVPKFSVSDIVYRLSDRIRHKNLELDQTIYSYKILILTPLHNSEKTLFRFAREIRELQYAHELISIAFGEDGSTDGTVEEAKLIIEELKTSGFRNISFYHFDIGQQVSGDWEDIHQRIQQYKRRQHLARARNLLLKNALSDEDYVLWIDSDIGDLPEDIIQHLLFAKKDIVTPSCLIKQGLTVRNYDKNIWRETPLSLENQKHMRANYLVIEGYGSTSRIYLPDLRGEGRIVPLDGVGGCTLLIRAKCHREGLDFPETLFDHHIETEGLAKKAKTMGYSVYGMPFVEVFHF
ncbi:uncharacterized protein LOC127712553 [Mytilus californianus]|uniref:uncharacterized protein LOC127712553 n=1 Tax=Mytilus californianus TaxID=6549 RepID=UPI002245DA36|nr:uncharacterized protein LOC127712553 [Mytilus californianus]XP_052075014.1 uncharacterized protein LOC127712553 [Mytilus californianus]